MSGKRVNDRSELAFHHLIQLMERQSDAMVGDAVLRKIVRANFLGAIPGFDLAAALGSNCFVLLGLFHFVKTRAQHPHGLRTIFDL